MPDTVNKIRHRMTIRVGHSTLSFAKPNDEGNVLFEPYVVKSGISIAANLREAFKTSEFLKDLSGRARVLVDSDTLLVPMSHFDEMKAGDLFFHSFPQYSQNHVFFNVMQEVSTVVLSSINKDLKLVLDDHFDRGLQPSDLGVHQPRGFCVYDRHSFTSFLSFFRRAGRSRGPCRP